VYKLGRTVRACGATLCTSGISMMHACDISMCRHFSHSVTAAVTATAAAVGAAAPAERRRCEGAGLPRQRSRARRTQRPRRPRRRLHHAGGWRRGEPPLSCNLDRAGCCCMLHSGIAALCLFSIVAVVFAVVVAIMHWSWAGATPRPWGALPGVSLGAPLACLVTSVQRRQRCRTRTLPPRCWRPKPLPHAPRRQLNALPTNMD
jgi:hypothetical protein